MVLYGIRSWYIWDRFPCGILLPHNKPDFTVQIVIVYKNPSTERVEETTAALPGWTCDGKPCNEQLRKSLFRFPVFWSGIFIFLAPFYIVLGALERIFGLNLLEFFVILLRKLWGVHAAIFVTHMTFEGDIFRVWILPMYLCANHNGNSFWNWLVEI